MFRIEPATAYSKDYSTCIEQAKCDQKRDARPALAVYPRGLEQYDAIYLGYPNYWGTMPMPVFTLLEAFDFTGKTILPFCTHEGSGLGRSIQDIRRLCPGANVRPGLALQGGQIKQSENKIRAWLARSKKGGRNMKELSVFPTGKKNEAFAQYFAGQSYLNMLSTQQVNIGNVTFEPGCRNNWHIHCAKDGGGQILLVTAGRGYYQEWGKPARELHPGDVVNIPANVKHWHGAAPNSWFAHLAVEVPGADAFNEWLEPVSDEDYEKLK